MRVLSQLVLIAGLAAHGAFAWCTPINPGDIFISIAIPDNGSIFRITQDGSVALFASGLDSPAGLAFSPGGQLYVVERSTGEITNVTNGGDFTGVSAHAFGFDFNSLRNLLIDNSGRILVANRADGTVVDVSAGGSASSAPVFAYGLDGTRDVFQTSSGVIYAVEEFSGEVTDISAGGDFRFSTPFASGFDLPYAIAESPDHELFLIEVLSGKVFNITGGDTSVSLFASNLGVTDEIIFNIDGTFLAVQEFANTIVDISSGGSGPYPVFASGLGQFPQQIAIAPLAADTDGDGVIDAQDNCTLVINPDQRDTNGDGFGNICDPDLNNDGAVNFADLDFFKYSFFSAPGEPTWNEDADLTGDGRVRFDDLSIALNFFFGPPGPGASGQPDSNNYTQQ